MKVKETLGNQPTIEKFVDYKIAQFEKTDKTMRSLFNLMFSEENNVMGEWSDGLRIIKTTYGQSKKNVNLKTVNLANKLKDVEYGSFVGIYLDNSIDWLETFWAVLQAGYRLFLLNMRLSDDLLNSVISEYDVKAVISQNKQFNTLNVSLASLNEINDGVCDNSHFANEVYLMSSNTSDHLKICGYTGEQFYYQINDSAQIIKRSKAVKTHYNGSLKLLTILPFYHIFGLVAVYIWFCFFSRTLVFLKDLNPKTVVSTVKRHEVTHIFAVPVFWEKVYKSAKSGISERGEKVVKKVQKGLKLSSKPILGKIALKKFAEVRENIFGESISFMINGGGYISPEVAAFLNGIGYTFVNGYGMTELGITSVELSEKAVNRNKCSVGRPFSSLEYKINEEGELLVRGKSIAHVICSDGQRRETDHTEWFNTHDLFVCKDGDYYIEGRKDDLIICASGENVNPNIIEPNLAVQGVQRLCLVPSVSGGKLVLIAEVSKYLGPESGKRISEELTAKLNEQGISSSCEKIILTSTPLMEADEFKINRKKIAKRLKAGEFNVIDLTKSVEDEDGEDKALIEKVTELFAKALDISPDNIKKDSNFFFDLNGTSIDYFTLGTLVEEEFEISLFTSEEHTVSTVRETAVYLRKHIGK